jgi:hypothetical protein
VISNHDRAQLLEKALVRALRDARDPPVRYRDKPVRRPVRVPTATAAEEELARLLTGGSDVTVDRFSGLLRHLKPNRLAGFLLAHRCAVDSVTMRRNVLDPQADYVARPTWST